MTLPDAVRSVLSKYADFSGRARRSEYWYWTLAVFILNIVTNIIDRAVGNQILGIIVSLALLLPGLAVGARRLHDTGRSALWLLLILTCVGIIVLIVFYVQEGVRGPNQYGDDPKGGGAQPFDPPLPPPPSAY